MMLKSFMEREYQSYRMSFGKFRRHLISDIEHDWIYWWLNKREHDETNNICDIDADHKMAAERKHNFNRTYLFLIYHLFITTGYRHKGNGAYEKMANQFWQDIDNSRDFTNNRMCRDEMDSFFYSVWSEGEPTF